MSEATERSERSNPFRRVVSQSGIYALGSMLLKAAGILLAPIYLNPAYLREVEFGTFALLEVTGQLSTLLIGLGLHAALMKFMADRNRSDDHGVIPFTVLMTVVLSSISFCAILYFTAPLLAGTILGDEARTGIFRLFVIYIAIKSTLVVPYTLMRFREKAALYVTASVSEIGVLVVAVYVLLVREGMGLQGLVLAYIVSSAVTALILIPSSLRGMRFRFSSRVARSLLRFGFPLAIAGLAIPVLHAGDRYLIEWLLDTGSVAVYTWGSRIASILNMLFVQSFNLAFMVIGLKSIGGGEGDYSLHKRTIRHFAAGASWCALGLAVFAGDITRLVGAGEAYYAASALVYPLSLGYLVYGIHIIQVNALYARSKTVAIGAFVVTATIANLLLNILLIPSLGIAGAAVATVASYGVLALLTYFYSQKIVSVRYDWFAVSRCIAGSVILYLLWTNMGADSLIVRAVLVALYAPMLMMLRVYTGEEVKSGVEVARNLLR